ncbi:MAG: hypothetical protein J6I45_10220, partial [Clostridia bacterium]|nr:hypothetical protein [Clostridia bacterium]
MTNKKSIRRAVLSSALALILCFTSLIGTTFAWFTDEVTSGRNLIVAGNLDVDLDYMDDNGGWKDIESATDLFKDSLWEPGKVQYVNLKVANVGTLALNYKLMINFFGENCVLDEQGQLTDLRLSDVIKVAYVEGGVEVTGTEEEQRAAAIKLGEQVGFGDIDTTAVTGKVYPDGNVDGKAVEVEYGVILYWAPSDDATDNLYNLNNGKAASTLVTKA